jgi:ADP-ribose pyrophosphatase YjhB (NUDIX family)
MDTTTKLYSIAEQLKAIGKEGLQHYVNEWNKLQHEKLVELGFRLWRILDEVPLSQSDESIQTVNPGIDFSNELRKISNDLKTINDTGRKNYLNPYVERHYEATRKLCTELDNILKLTPLCLSTDFGNIRDVTTPLIGAEAAVFIDGKLLLIQRNDVGLWAIPGGGVDVGNTLSEAALRELEEETRLRGSVKRLLGFFDSRLWGSKLKMQTFHTIFEVDVVKGEPEKTIEALDCGFFGKDELPPLSPGHDMRVPFLFELIQDESKIPYFD